MFYIVPLLYVSWHKEQGNNESEQNNMRKLLWPMTIIFLYLLSFCFQIFFPVFVSCLLFFVAVRSFSMTILYIKQMILLPFNPLPHICIKYSETFFYVSRVELRFIKFNFRVHKKNSFVNCRLFCYSNFSCVFKFKI